VLYIAGEGTYGIGKRVMAWAGGEIALQSALWAHWGQINDLVPMLDGRQFQALLDSIGEQPIPPRLIVVDTLARAMTGGDENSAKDMGLFVHRCGQLRDATGAAVLLVHHTRTDGERERGSSALRGAADVMLQLDRDEAGNVILSTVKTKDDQPPEPLELRLERVVLGLDEEGEEISSLRVVPLPPGSPRASDLGGSPLVVLGALTSAPKGAPWLSITDLCGATKLHRDTVRKVLRQLEEAGKIIVEQRGNMTRSRARPDQV
jgi:DNA-binding transcriptional ArsR family regulator